MKMKMKKVIALGMVLTMLMSLVACGGPDDSTLRSKLNETVDSYNEVANLLNDNGITAESEVAQTFNALADELDSIRLAIEGDEELTQEQIDEYIDELDELKPIIDDCNKEFKDIIEKNK